MRKTKALIVGDPIDEKVQVGPMSNECQAANVERIVTQTIAKGAKILTGGSCNGLFFEHPGARIFLAQGRRLSCLTPSHRRARARLPSRGSEPGPDSGEFRTLLFPHGAVIGCRGFAEPQGFRREWPHPVRQRLPSRARRSRRVIPRQARRL